MIKLYKTDVVNRLITRAFIRRGIQTRKSVQENQPDRIADLLEEAAEEISRLRNMTFWQWLTNKRKYENN